MKKKTVETYDLKNWLTFEWNISNLMDAQFLNDIFKTENFSKLMNIGDICICMQSYPMENVSIPSFQNEMLRPKK